MAAVFEAPSKRQQNSDLSRSCKSASRVKAASSQAQWLLEISKSHRSNILRYSRTPRRSAQQKTTKLRSKHNVLVGFGLFRFVLVGCFVGNGRGRERGEEGEEEEGGGVGRCSNIGELLFSDPKLDKRLRFRIASGAHIIFRTTSHHAVRVTASQTPTIDVKYHTCLQLAFIVARTLILSWFLTRTAVHSDPVHYRNTNWSIARLLYSVAVVVEETIYVITLPRWLASRSKMILRKNLQWKPDVLATERLLLTSWCSGLSEFSPSTSHFDGQTHSW